MADNSKTTIVATFDTRASADLAVEHLVQQYGVSRPDVFIQAAGDRNSAGSTASSPDFDRKDPPLEGEIEVSADISSSQIVSVHRSFGEAGTLRISTR